ncbi:hypothetical protein CTA1_10529 [Colletotrichum tanaceti]|uniref:Uncharacterized protein n=1 Tax=Colletotrichum tanaceti TaxID=1306861 RepID=A0A4U6X9P4_9PEZI|nr:hypothetical protein CTA1_10529 [Colletotrichum tanaceti]
MARLIQWASENEGFLVTVVVSRGEATGRAVVAFIFISYFFHDTAWTPLLQAASVTRRVSPLHSSWAWAISHICFCL